LGALGGGGAVDSKGSAENFTLYIGRIYVDN